MKSLLLSLALGLVCAQEPQPEQDPTQLSGAWKTHSITARNQEKTSDNGLCRVNGKCVELTTKGTKTDNKAYDVDYGGKDKFKGIHVSENALIGYNEKVDDKGKIPKMTALFGKGNKTQDQDLEKLKELMREKGIPEESMVHVIKADDCPSSE